MLLLFVLFSAFPALFFVLDFSFVIPSVGVALLLACLGLHVFDRAMDALEERSARRGRLAGLLAAQALLGAGAVGVYQSFILLVAVGCCGIFLLRYLREPGMTLRTILLVHAYLLAALVASIVLSYLINHGLQWLIGHAQGISGRFVQPGPGRSNSPGAVIHEDPAGILGGLRRQARDLWLPLRHLSGCCCCSA